MHGGINVYDTSENEQERNAAIKKKQASSARLTLVFKVIINIMQIICIF